MKPWLKEHESHLLWVYVPALVGSMLSFAFVGFWMYVVFVALAAPAVVGAVVHWVKGQAPDRDTWIMLLAVVAFLVLGGYSYATRGINWPQ